MPDGEIANGAEKGLAGASTGAVRTLGNMIGGVVRIRHRKRVTAVSTGRIPVARTPVGRSPVRARTTGGAARPPPPGGAAVPACGRPGRRTNRRTGFTRDSPS
ncbi:hypothetical protein GCM10010293_00440 [Streptomyces griseoflavus]|nr:hypothetical protein GCM10010293_00440 [Streptomyces griseoflavus]